MAHPRVGTKICHADSRILDAGFRSNLLPLESYWRFLPSWPQRRFLATSYCENNSYTTLYSGIIIVQYYSSTSEYCCNTAVQQLVTWYIAAAAANLQVTFLLAYQVCRRVVEEHIHYADGLALFFPSGQRGSLASSARVNLLTCREERMNANGSTAGAGSIIPGTWYVISFFVRTAAVPIYHILACSKIYRWCAAAGPPRHTPYLSKEAR